MMEPDVRLRPGTPEDSRACHALLWASVTDLGQRRGSPLEGSADEWWSGDETMMRFMAEHAAEWWIAEAEGAENPIGYARSIERGGLFELTELFVRPGQQSRGIGRRLIEAAFPIGRGEVRSIIATTDVRATTRYYAAGTVARFPYFSLVGPPRADAGDAGDLDTEPIAPASEALAAVSEIDRAILQFPRGAAELELLATSREGTLFRRDGRAVGFAFVSPDGSGPMAALEPDDQPAILRHAEARAAALDVKTMTFEVAGINEVAMRHLMARGFRIDPWINLLMSSRPFGQFDRYIGYSPPIFL